MTCLESARIETAKYKDYQDIKKLWKQQGDLLGIPFDSTIYQLIKSRRFFLVKIDDELIGMGAYTIKRNGYCEIKKLCVENSMRGNGIGIGIIKYIIGIREVCPLPVIVECKSGAENNKFYEKIGKYICTKKCKTMDVKIYRIRKEIINNGKDVFERASE